MIDGGGSSHPGLPISLYTYYGVAVRLVSNLTQPGEEWECGLRLHHILGTCAHVARAGLLRLATSCV